MKYIFFPFLLLTFSLAYAQDTLKYLEQQLRSDPDNVELLLKLGIAHHNQAEIGDKNSLKKCEDILNHILALDNNNHEALAYLGSILTMKGRDASLPWQKIKYVKQGVDKIDKAVHWEPDNLRVRLVRAMNSLNLPSFFNRLKYSMEDFTFIIDSEQFKDWSLEDQAMIYYNLGAAWKKDENAPEAQKNFEMVIQIALESTWGIKAQEELETLK